MKRILEKLGILFSILPFRITQNNSGYRLVNLELFDWYQKFIGLRKKYKSLQLGDYTTIEKDDLQRFYFFSRKYNSEEVLVLVNRSDKPIQYKNTIFEESRYKEVFSKKGLKSVTIAPMDLVVLYK